MAIKGWIDLQHTHVDVEFACWNVLLLIKKNATAIRVCWKWIHPKYSNEEKAIVCSIVLKREHANFQLSNYLLLEHNRPNTTTKL